MSGANQDRKYEAAIGETLQQVQLALLWAKRTDGITDTAEYLRELAQLSNHDARAKRERL